MYKGNNTSWTPAPEEQVCTDEFTTEKTVVNYKSVDGIKTITKVENNQSGFDKRVATVEKDAAAIKQNVSLIQTYRTRKAIKAKSWMEKILQKHFKVKTCTLVEDYIRLRFRLNNYS
ncbi:hypothetical protein ACPA9J_16965 [Pseudomonas aeruginosa]